MKSILTQFIFVLFSLSSLFAQSTKFKYLSSKKLSKMTYSEHDLGEVDCGNTDEGPIESHVMIEIGAVDPEGSDSSKEERIQELDTLLAQLKGYSDCTEIDVIIIHLGEALFIRKDDMEVYSDEYNKKGRKLNSQRFWSRYQTKFEEWLPGKTIMLSDYGW